MVGTPAKSEVPDRTGYKRNRRGAGAFQQHVQPHLRTKMFKHSAPDTWPPLRWLGTMALRIDDHLRRRDHVCEYSSEPRCVFRMQVVGARQDLVLADGTTVRTGDKLINIHLWNEHIPVIPPEGATFAWGRRMGMAMDFSLRQLADFISCHPELVGITAIRANLAVSTARTTTQLLRVMQHYGFEIVLDDKPVSWRQRLHQWGENVLGLLLLVAVNPAAARISVLSRVRSQVLLSRNNLDRRYGALNPTLREPVSSTQSARSQSAPLRVSAASRV